MAYFAHYNFDLQALFQVTSSHNPKDDNGLKMMIDKNTLFNEEILSLRPLAEEVVIPTLATVSTTQLPSIHEELCKKYIDYLHTQIRLSKKYKIVVDCGNGMAGGFARQVFTPYASELEILFEEVDCSFPNHEA